MFSIKNQNHRYKQLFSIHCFLGINWKTSRPLRITSDDVFSEMSGTAVLRLSFWTLPFYGAYLSSAGISALLWSWNVVGCLWLSAIGPVALVDFGACLLKRWVMNIREYNYNNIYSSHRFAGWKNFSIFSPMLEFIDSSASWTNQQLPHA